MQGAFERLNERAATLAAEEARQITAGEEPKRALVAPESTDTPTMGEVTLIRPAPGTGKSYALGNVLDPRFIEGKSVVVLSETLELSKQNAERWEEVHGIKPVVLKGRRVEGMCISKSYDRIARKVEDAGQSPSRVCSKCPKRARCPFMEQSRELAVGVPTLGRPHMRRHGSRPTARLAAPSLSSMRARPA